MKERRPLERIYRLKTVVVALISLAFGVALLTLSRKASSDSSLHWLSLWPVGEIGGTLTAAGLFGIIWDYFDGRDREERENQRLAAVLKASAPDLRDAVVQAFAVGEEDLKRVASPALLDEIATNVLSLRLGDRQFAEEIYADVRDQAVRAPERWHDVDVSIRLSSVDERNTAGVARLAVSVQWEYTVIPSHPVQRFACVSDRDEYYELITDVPATSTWFMTPRPGFDASARESFELQYFSVDGEERPIRRTARKTGQTYSAVIGPELVDAHKAVRIKHVYRAIADPATHRLFIEIAQPARGVSLELDYTDSPISRMSVSDLVTSAQRPRVTEIPGEAAGRVLSVDVPGWLLPKAGFTFVWTLGSEELRDLPPADPTSATPDPASRPDGSVQPKIHRS